MKIGREFNSIRNSKHTVLISVSDMEQDLLLYTFVVFEQKDGPDISIEFKGMVEDGNFESRELRVIQRIDTDDFSSVINERICFHAYKMDKDRKIIRRNYSSLRRSSNRYERVQLF